MYEMGEIEMERWRWSFDCRFIARAAALRGVGGLLFWGMGG